MRAGSTRRSPTARSARSSNPLSPEPLYALAYAYEAAGDEPGARAAYTRATTLQPENPETWYQLGLFEFIVVRDMCAAYQALNHSYTLDPKNTHWKPNGELDQARDCRQRSGRPRLRPRDVLARTAPSLARPGYEPRTTTAWAPWSCAGRIPSSGPTVRIPRSCASRRPSPS